MASKMSLAFPDYVQAEVIEALRTEYASGQLGADQAAIKRRASELAAQKGYGWEPKKHWIYHIRTDIFKVPKRPYG